MFEEDSQPMNINKKNREKVLFKMKMCFNTNHIEIPLQTSLSYILLLMVCANYYAPYPNDHV